MKKQEKEVKEISILSADQKTDISSTSILMAYAYAVWGCSLQDSKAIMSQELIDNRIAKYPYLSPPELEHKVAIQKLKDPIRYIIDVPTQKMEEIFLPDLTQLGEDGIEVKVSHFWGNTGFQPGAIFPNDNLKNHEAELKKSANSYMGSVVLVEDQKNPSNSKLYITFRGSRGGNTSSASVLGARKGEGNPDWVTDLDLGGYFSFLKSGFAPVKDFLRMFSPPSIDRSKIYNHEGICKTYYSCKPGIETAILELGIINLNSFPGQVIVTGHSLGGGLATICAYDLRGGFNNLDNVTFRHYTSRLIPTHLKTNQFFYVTDPQKVHCVSYSAPAVGNDLFTKDFAALVPNNLRVVINSDLITVEFKTVYNLHHVHGKVDLGKMSKALEKSGGIPNHLQFNSIPDPRAHQIPKVMELAHFVVESKHRYVPLVRTIPKNDIKQHSRLEIDIRNLINEISIDPAAEKYLALLEEFQALNFEIISFCTKSYYDDKPLEYINYLAKMKSVIQKIIKKIPEHLLLNPTDSHILQAMTAINHRVELLFDNFSQASQLRSPSLSRKEQWEEKSSPTSSSPERSSSPSGSVSQDVNSDEDIDDNSESSELLLSSSTLGTWPTIFPKVKIPSIQEMDEENGNLSILKYGQGS